MSARGDERDRREGEATPDPPQHSWGNISKHHWSRARKGMNEEALEHYRERSRKAGVEEGGGLRNHYCMSCQGVIPLEYDAREPAAKGPLERCPHCGAELDARVREMFNWVEIDQVPDSDFKALLPVLLAGFGVLALAGATAWWLLR